MLHLMQLRARKQRRGGVPQVVNSETITETGTSAGRRERDEPPVGQPHDAAAGHGEQEIIGALAVDTRRQLDGDKPRERDGPGLARGQAQGRAAHLREEGWDSRVERS